MENTDEVKEQRRRWAISAVIVVENTVEELTGLVPHVECGFKKNTGEATFWLHEKKKPKVIFGWLKTQPFASKKEIERAVVEEFIDSDKRGYRWNTKR